MFTAATIEDLPENVPTILRDAVALSLKLDGGYFAQYKWEYLPCAVVMHFRSVNSTLKTSAGMVGRSGITRPLVDELRDLIHNNAVPVNGAGEHVGTAAVSDGLSLNGVDALPDVTGPELDEALADLVAEGKVRQMRSTLAVLSSGWRYECHRERAGNIVTITVYEPGDVWNLKEVKLLRVLDAKLLTRS